MRSTLSCVFSFLLLFCEFCLFCAPSSRLNHYRFNTTDPRSSPCFAFTCRPTRSHPGLSDPAYVSTQSSSFVLVQRQSFVPPVSLRVFIFGHHETTCPGHFPCHYTHGSSSRWVWASSMYTTMNRLSLVIHLISRGIV